MVFHLGDNMPLKFNLKKTVRQYLSSVHDVMAFGKMRGSTVADICHDEPTYLTWLEEMEIVTVDEDLMEIIWEAIANRDQPGFWDDWEEIPF